MKYSFEDSIIKIKAITKVRNEIVFYKFNIDNELFFLLKVDKVSKSISLQKILYKGSNIECLKNSSIYSNVNIYFSKLTDNLSSLLSSNNRRINDCEEIIDLVKKLKYLNNNSLLNEFQTLNDIKDDTSILLKIHENMLYVMNIGLKSYVLSITNRLVYESSKNQTLVSNVKSYEFKDKNDEHFKMIEKLYGKCDLDTLSFIYNQLRNENKEIQKIIDCNFLSLIY